MAQIGLKDLHYAILTKDDSDSVEYDQPKKVGKAISANINPTVNNAELYADDGLSETASALGAISVTIGADKLTKQVQADLLGHKVNSDGVLEKSSTDTAPYVALGFRSEMSNGKYRYVWLYKGKFQPVEQNYQTKEGTPAFQTPTINATFMKRDHDDKWEGSVEEGDDSVASGIIDNWFNAVYQETPEV